MRPTRRHSRVLASLVILLTVGAAGAASGYWRGSGTGTGSASAGTVGP